MRRGWKEDGTEQRKDIKREIFRWGGGGGKNLRERERRDNFWMRRE